MFLLSFVSLSCKGLFFYKESKLPALAFVLYLLLLSLTYEFVQIRYAFAMGFIMIAFSLSYRGKLRSSIALICFASIFHYFSLFSLVFLLANKVKIKLWYIYGLAIITFAIFSQLQLGDFIGQYFSLFGNGSIIERRIMGYVTGDSEFSKAVGFSSVLVLRFYFLLFLMLMLEHFYIKDDQKFNFYLKLCVVGAFIVSFFSFNAIIYSRATSILEIVLILVISIGISKLKTFTQRLLLSSCISIIFYLFFLQGQQSESVYEYNTWLSELL